MAKQLKDLSLSDLEIDIYLYSDYQVLLQDYVDRCQQVNRKYSFRYLSKRIGVNSSGYMQWIIQGKRQISDSVLVRLIEILGLNNLQQTYFELLVRIGRLEEGSPLREEYQRRLDEMVRQSTPSRVLEESQAKCISSWFHWVLREMVMLRGCTYNIQWFQRCLMEYASKSSLDIIRCLEDLKAAEFIQEDDYDLKASEGFLDFEKHPRIGKLLKQYQQQALEVAMEAMSVPSKQREYNSILVPTTPEQYQRFKEKVAQWPMDAIEALEAPEGEASMLVSLSLQLFPVAKTPDN